MNYHEAKHQKMNHIELLILYRERNNQCLLCPPSVILLEKDLAIETQCLLFIDNFYHYGNFINIKYQCLAVRSLQDFGL